MRHPLIILWRSIPWDFLRKTDLYRIRYGVVPVEIQIFLLTRFFLHFFLDILMINVYYMIKRMRDLPTNKGEMK